MPGRTPLEPTDLGLFTDLYELRMAQAYLTEGLNQTATFELYFRSLPSGRNFLVACGVEDAIAYLEDARFSAEAVDYLSSQGFSADFGRWLRAFRFRGDVEAVPEGTVVFPHEPILRVTAPIAEAQIAETFLLNQIQCQTALASKAARSVLAAGDRAVVDFASRRVYGTDAALKLARTSHLVGFAGTSNVLAGKTYGIPVFGTMAHSYVEAHPDEAAAYRAFAEQFPGTTLLVDTYDTVEGIRRVVELARSMGERFDVRAVRLDSGDLVALAKETRRLLDDDGLAGVKIFASGGIDEYEIARLLGEGAPIDGFGVGTKVGVCDDAPELDSAYKLVELGGTPRMKLSGRKATLPGRKQVFRVLDGDTPRHDILGLHDEDLDGRPLLRPMMRHGRPTDEAFVGSDATRTAIRDTLGSLPPALRSLTAADPPYRVVLSERLQAERDRLAERLRSGRPDA